MSVDPSGRSSTTDDTATPPRGRVVLEVWIVLGLSLARAGVFAAIIFVDRLTRDDALGDQTATLNPSQSDRAWLDAVYQVHSLVFPLVPVLLALYLLAPTMRAAARRVGLDWSRPWRDVGAGALIAAAIGLPGLGFYALGRALGITVAVQPAGLDATWWTIPVLAASAVQAGLLEEVVAVGYLSERLRDLRWSVPAVIVASALLRGSYHLYQGFGPFLGNVVMGVVFAAWYARTRRVMPLVIAHTLMDAVVFIGYPLMPEAWLQAVHLL
ncbi:MAG: CPBP family intramembrane metalloprotease [Micrococcales bacterium]|nr:CPBP family intramembrane metalloprotease [Micrococcales bacterium]